MQRTNPPVEGSTLDLFPVEAPADVTPVKEPWLRRLLATVFANPALLIMVVAPTLLCAIYLFLVAADRYEAETKFVVRSPSNAAASQIASLVQGSSIVRTSDEAYIIHAYLQSRDILRRLLQTSDLLEKLARPEADFWWRYPGLLNKHSEEHLYRHMRSIIGIDYDHSTGISTLKVIGFRPQDAKDLADALLTESETLINRLSERAQTDAIRSAEREVEFARRNAHEAQEHVTAFRNRNAMIDPNRVSTTALETISRLALEQAQTNALLAELEKGAPQSAQISSLRFRLAALEQQIQKERQQLAGADTALAPKIAEYERLVLQREFAERTFASALTSLEAARLDTQRQRLFLERISNPASPDHARYPYRLLGVLAVFGIAWMLYAVFARLITDALSHSGI